MAWLLNPGLRVAKNLDFKIRLFSRALPLEGADLWGREWSVAGAFA